MSENRPENMSEDMHENVQWQVIDEVAGDPQAELIRSLLEADGISVILSQEGAGRALGLTIGALGMVQIVVPGDQSEQARKILDEYYDSLQTDAETDAADPSITAED